MCNTLWLAVVELWSSQLSTDRNDSCIRSSQIYSQHLPGVFHKGKQEQQQEIVHVTEHFIRCIHCRLPHDGHAEVCPTTGLPLQQHTTAPPPTSVPPSGPVSLPPRKQRSVTGTAALIGSIVDRKYRISGLLGEGGMSAIYEATELGSDRRVALKMLHPKLSKNPEAIARLQREAEIVKYINHPNICAIFAMVRSPQGRPYLVMERLFGESLDRRLKTKGRQPFATLAPLVCQVLAALEAAHRKNILHRDLKPENVFIQGEPSGPLSAKLLDFGISKAIGDDFEQQQRLTTTGMVMGTPYYMAPEQARGDNGLDQRVDLWAIGVLLYEGLAGTRPFLATNYNALLVSILTSEPRPIREVLPELSPDIAAVVDKALAKDADLRFQSAKEFATALTDLMVTHDTIPPPPFLSDLADSMHSTQDSQRLPTITETMNPPELIDDETGNTDAIYPVSE